MTKIGLEGITVADTRLSLVDGTQGKLIIAGHHIQDFAELSFEEAAQILWGGATNIAIQRPSAAKLLRPLADQLHGRQPMEALRLGLSALPNEANQDLIAAAFPVILGMIRWGTDSPEPSPDFTQAEEILHQLHRELPAAEASRALESYLVTVSEHGMNASTFCCRVVCSTEASRIDSTVAALAALSGPLHGGAPGPVLDLLDSLEQEDDVSGKLRDMVTRGERLMGFGHRVYRSRDPRAAVLQKAVRRLCPSPFLVHAEAVERVAQEVLADLKPHRPLKTNVEFYTAVLLQELGFERNWFTTLFASGRILGWMAHYDEQRELGKLMRPRARYVGEIPE